MPHAYVVTFIALLTGCVIQTDIHDYPCPCGGGELCSPMHRCDPRGPATITIASLGTTGPTLTLSVSVSGDTSTVSRWELRATPVVSADDCDAAFDRSEAGTATWPSTQLDGRTTTLPATLGVDGLAAATLHCLRLDAVHTTGERSASAPITVATP